ncbi:factor of interpulse interval [Carabus blaptoides fortunei]
MGWCCGLPARQASSQCRVNRRYGTVSSANEQRDNLPLTVYVRLHGHSSSSSQFPPYILTSNPLDQNSSSIININGRFVFETADPLLEVICDSLNTDIIHPSDMIRFHRDMYCRLILSYSIVISLVGLSLSALNLAPTVQDVVRYVNESYIVTCTEDTKKPVTWYTSHGVAVHEKGHPHVTNMSSGTALVFEKISVEDRGHYHCKNEEDSVSFKLIVISPITFIDTPLLQTGHEHQPAVIKCQVRGDPKPKILWKFDGRDVAPPKYSIVAAGLRIDNVTLDDRGTYTCRAYQVSQVTSMYEEKSIKLDVYHKPMRKRFAHSKVNQVYGYVGGIANLTCEVIAVPDASIGWFRPYKDLAKMQGTLSTKPNWSALQFQIKDVTAFGDYLCKATNDIGTLNQIITLLEGVKPPKPRELILRGVNSDIFNIEIIGPDLNQTQLHGNMMPLGYRIQYKPKGLVVGWSSAEIIDFNDLSEGGFYILTGLSHNTDYEIRAATRNMAGFSDYTPPVTYRTLRIHADSITSGSITVTADYFLIATIFGSLSL